MANVNETRSRRRMQSIVSGTDMQEGRHDTQPSTTLQAKIDTNLLETSRRPFIYTPAHLHENTVNPHHYFHSSLSVLLML